MYKFKHTTIFAKQEKPEKPAGGNVTRPVQPQIIMPKKRFAMAFLAMLVTLGLFLFPKVTAAKYAMLYIMGDNGKKSGRASGNVYLRNGRMRGMAFFATTLNSFTSLAKSIFAFYSANWKNLTDAERLTWTGFEKFVSNRFAESVKVTGIQAYKALNTNIANSGGTSIDTAPSKSATAPAYIPLIGAVANASTGNISITYSAYSDASTAFIFATKPLSAGVAKPSKTAFRLVSIGDFTVASPIAFGTDYTNRFGAITSQKGARIFIRVVAVNNTNGLTSIANQISTVIVP